MSQPLVFMMGQFAAEFPTDRQYAKNHMWAERRDTVYRFGLSAYAVRLLQDVFFLDWCVDPGTQLKERQQIGSIESKKAESDLYSPVTGAVTQFNKQLLKDPSAINVDKYGLGWLFEIEPTHAPLLSPDEYLAHLESVWEVTQRTIKGQLNE